MFKYHQILRQILNGKPPQNFINPIATWRMEKAIGNKICKYLFLRKFLVGRQKHTLNGLLIDCILQEDIILQQLPTNSQQNF